ncbi:hypothetical protein J7L06_08120 [Candidatus Bathyarchaeota archaeon]|nr:hypothetical protein [Candidatus Bathyarchaeota archaeon]
MKGGGSIALSLFYLVSGVMMVLEAILSGLSSFHLGILGVLSTVLALMVLKKRKAAVTLLLFTFIPMIVFGAITLYDSLLDYLIGGYRQSLLAAAFSSAYLIAVAASFIYLIKNRGSFTQ